MIDFCFRRNDEIAVVLLFLFKTCGFAELFYHIGFFPGEVWQVSAEVSAIRGLGVNRAGELEMRNHTLGRQGE